MPTRRGTTRRRILRYPQSPDYTENDILLIDSADEEIVRLVIADKKPFKCFAPSNANLSKYEGVFRQYLKYIYSLDAAETSIARDDPHLLFFGIWERLIEDFNNMLPRSV